MSFCKVRYRTNSESNTDGIYELIRYCSKLDTVVIGGASKLFKFFVANYNFTKVVSYANCDIGNGNMYDKLGFMNCGHTGISYWWYKNNKRENRHFYNKNKFPNSKEIDKMTELGYVRINGCGNLRYEWTKEINNDNI